VAATRSASPQTHYSTFQGKWCTDNTQRDLAECDFGLTTRRMGPVGIRHPQLLTPHSFKRVTSHRPRSRGTCGGLRWLAAYSAIVALAMVTVAVAVTLTVGLFRTIGPKHTRLCAQIVAAVIGASFAIGVQLAAILYYGTPSRVVLLQSEAVTRYAPDSGSTLWLPARGILGDMLALVFVLGISAIMLAATICIEGPVRLRAAIPRTPGRRPGQGRMVQALSCERTAGPLRAHRAELGHRQQSH
jgi:hypothetical protein